MRYCLILFRKQTVLLCLWLLLFLHSSAAKTADPVSLNPQYAIELFASEPDIVTPIGATIDSKNRLLVIESHTHFPPENYSGPKHDRLQLIEDTDGDGRADRFRTFYSDLHATMSVRRGNDDWVYVAERNQVFRIRDGDGDDVAETREPIANLISKGDYPHNGLGGLALDGHGNLYFGLGENLGEPYQLTAADGSTHAGGNEGGAVFRCTLNGQKLERVAIGFWNPFGLCFDPSGRLFAVDNDPDSRPPCRLLHVVPTADYGYQMRFGRSGKHPLQAWNGELPGTLPMAAGTGEAPSAVVPFDGSLWTTSWGDNRVECFTLATHGASCKAHGTITVQGDQLFRPVDFAVAQDGSLFITDWVDRSYNIHGKGRIWRLRKTVGPSIPAVVPPPAAWLPLSTAEQRARSLFRTNGLATPIDSDLLESLKDDLKNEDPFLRQAAVAQLIATDPAAIPVLESLADPLARLSVVLAQRWLNRPDATVPAALADVDERVQLLAIRWIAEAKMQTFRPLLEQILLAEETSPPLFIAAVAAIDWLDGQQGLPEHHADSNRRLQAIWQDAAKPEELRVMAMRLTSPNASDMNISLLSQSVHSKNPLLAREAVRLLTLIPGTDTATQLVAIANDAALPTDQRADAIIGLGRSAVAHADQIARLADDPVPEVAREARRITGLKRAALPSPTPDGLPRPDPSDTLAWQRHLEAGGNREAGWRIFNSQIARCSTCHMLDGRGASIGPDLTSIGAKIGRTGVLTSLLQPSREIAPRYQSYTVTLKDGRVISGLSLGLTEDDRHERFSGVDGQEITVARELIESRLPLATSIMPSGLEQGLTDEDLRDLLTLLESRE